MLMININIVLFQVWHRFCFKCKDCGMALNMRNYKGFDKEPYCDA